MVTPARAYAMRRLKRRRVRIYGQPPAMPVNVAASYTPEIRGGQAPFTLSVVGGTLPTGLALNAGVISGTPTVTGATNVFLQVKDAGGTTAQRQLSFAVVP